MGEPRRDAKLYAVRGCGRADAPAMRTGALVVDHVHVEGRAVAKEDARDEEGGRCPPLKPPPNAKFPAAMVDGGKGRSGWVDGNPL